jgi:hypothetical protein
MRFPGRGFMTIEFLLEDLPFCRKEKFRESLSPSLPECPWFDVQSGIFGDGIS